MIDYITQEIEKVCPIYGVNSNGEIHFKDATAQQQAIAFAKYQELTSAQGIAAYEAWKLKEDIKAQILAIEREQIMPRKTREIQIELMEYLGGQQGLTPEQIYAVNPAYKGMVDVDTQIRALRELL